MIGWSDWSVDLPCHWICIAVEDVLIGQHKCAEEKGDDLCTRSTIDNVATLQQNIHLILIIFLGENALISTLTIHMKQNVMFMKISSTKL